MLLSMPEDDLRITRTRSGEGEAMAPGPIPLTAAQVRALNTLVNDQELANLVVGEVVVHRVELPDESDHFQGTVHVRMTVTEPGDDGATHTVESLLGAEGDVVARADAG
jgi:hypothetical protein